MSLKNFFFYFQGSNSAFKDITNISKSRDDQYFYNQNQQFLQQQQQQQPQLLPQYQSNGISIITTKSPGMHHIHHAHHINHVPHQNQCNVFYANAAMPLAQSGTSGDISNNASLTYASLSQNDYSLNQAPSY